MSAYRKRETMTVGTRVQLKPHLDWWMRGARYGAVVKVTRLYTHVRLDATGRVVKLAHCDVEPV